MSHTTTVTLIADQEIELCGETINIHDLKTIIMSGDGKVVEYTVQDSEGKE